MEKQTVIIELTGGNIQNVLSNNPNLKVVVVDYDNLKDETTADQRNEITDILDSLCDGRYTNLSLGHGTTLEQVRNL
jgi:hypothetical protein